MSEYYRHFNLSFDHLCVVACFVPARKYLSSQHLLQKTLLLLCVVRMHSFVFTAHLLVEHPGIGGDGVLQSLLFYFNFIILNQLFFVCLFLFSHRESICIRITVELVEPGCVCMS